MPKTQPSQATNGSISIRSIFLVSVGVILLLIVYTTAFLSSSCNNGFDEGIIIGAMNQPDVTSVSSLRKSRQHDADHTICRWYMAESAIPNSGLGLFAGTGVLPREPVGFPDICIFVGDAPKNWTHLRSHSFGGGSFFGQYEGSNSRAACEGFTTNYNTVPRRLVNTQMMSPVLSTHAGVHRSKYPAAGSFTHHFGIHGQAVRTITAGSELTLDYGDWDFSDYDEEHFVKPERSVDWLQKHGWCIDHLRVDKSTIEGAGRGAFARMPLQAGDVVVPLPLQAFRNLSIFAETVPSQLFMNYCLQPANSNMMFYPYGPAFNLVNHDSQRANVALRWSKSSNHHASWLDLEYEEFWKVVSPGGLVLEVVALRDIEVGEEIFLDYGKDWEEAWEQHVVSWSPPEGADSYVYPAEMDETETLRTMKEQKTNPYPANLITMCSTPDWERTEDRHIEWYEDLSYAWWELMVWCYILDKQIGSDGNYEYEVALNFDMVSPKTLEFDESIPYERRYIDKKVPRRAIRFMERPYMDDEHLQNAFRHPIRLDDKLVPAAWRTG